MLVKMWESPRVILLEEEGYVFALHAPEPNGGIHCALQTMEETMLDGKGGRGDHCYEQQALGCLGMLRVDGSELSPLLRGLIGS